MTVEQTHIIERAYQLARSGECRTITDIRRTLKAERYCGIDFHTTGLGIRRELMRLCKEANTHGESMG